MQIRCLLATLPLFACFAVFAGETEEIQQLLKNRQFSQALERAEKLIASNPKDTQARFLKGVIQSEMGLPDKAIQTFASLTSDYPNLPEPYNNLAVLYAQQNQLDKARTALQKAMRTNPAYATAHENLGDLYASLASQSYDKALQLNNKPANTQTKLTLVRELYSKAPQSPAQVPPAPVKPVASATPQVKPAMPPAPPQAAPAAKPPTVASVQPAKQAPAASTQPPVQVKPSPAPTSNHDAEKAKIIAAVEGWASAWSRKDVKGYLAYYASDFQPPNGLSRKAWEAERAQRIDKPGKLQVKVDDVKVTLSGEKATVRFRQNYESATLKSSAGKTMVFVKDLNDFATINAVYEAFFTEHNAAFPARSCVEVARLPKDAGIEIEAIAVA